jgi:hypothetical protein
VMALHGVSYTSCLWCVAFHLFCLVNLSLPLPSRQMFPPGPPKNRIEPGKLYTTATYIGNMLKATVPQLFDPKKKK